MSNGIDTSNGTDAGVLVSFVIATRNRAGTLMETLRRLGGADIASETGGSFEIIVIDNASTDDTVGMIARRHPSVRVVQCEENHGASARNLALASARGWYVMFLEDDCCPQAGAVAAMIGAFENGPRLGAVAFEVRSADGSEACAEFPGVFVGGGFGVRAAALRQAGSLAEDLSTQAAEYDLAIRLMDCRWKIASVSGCRVRRQNARPGRSAGGLTRCEVRDDTLLLCRRAPAEAVTETLGDWMRYSWMVAKTERRRAEVVVGAIFGLVRFISNPRVQRASLATFDRFRWRGRIEAAIEEWAHQREIGAVLMAGLGKNAGTYFAAARRAGLHVVGVTDDRFAGFDYRGRRIVDSAAACRMAFDGVIVANSSPIAAGALARRWRLLTAQPVLDALENDELVAPATLPPRAIAA